VVCVDYGDKRGSKKDIWFPALIVAPTAQETPTKIGKDEHLVRSFKDGRFYQVAKKDAREFTKEMVLSKSESNSSALRSAMEKAITFMEKHDLPPHWDYDLLMGNTVPQVRSFSFVFSCYCFDLYQFY
jgi:Ras-related protein Rab-1A